MNIGLDYDDTFTRDPLGWAEFCRFMQSRGHAVFLVTWRAPDETEEDIEILKAKLDGVHFTTRKAKEKYMYEQGIRIDVWIDDNPRAILHTMEGWE